MINLATKTLDTINEALEADQGAAYRGLLAVNLPKVKDAYRTDNEVRRGHLGASVIGSECLRNVWYGFRWTTKQDHEGRILRLFNRGHLEEAHFISLLQMIGIQVWFDDNGNGQFRTTDINGHFGGSLDAVLRGVPDLPPSAAVLAEFKTHNDKSFQKLKTQGLVASKKMHYVQMQLYMGKYDLPYGLYCAVNKNDDSLYFEIITFDATLYAFYQGVAQSIIHDPQPPQKISKNPSWYYCRHFCDHTEICHHRSLPERNCRTCHFARPGTEAEGGTGLWYCGQHKVFLDVAQQQAGCSGYTVASTYYQTED